MKRHCFLVLGTVCLGCARDRVPSRTGSGWTQVDGTFVGLVEWGEGTALLIYCDGDTEGGGGGLSSSSSVLTAHAWLRTKDGRTVDWWCQTSDGMTGQVRINGQQFNLEDGALFLVSTRGGQVQIEQHKRYLLEMAPEDKNLKRFTKEDPEVKRFLSRVK